MINPECTLSKTEVIGVQCSACINGHVCGRWHRIRRLDPERNRVWRNRVLVCPFRIFACMDHHGVIQEPHNG